MRFQSSPVPKDGCNLLRPGAGTSSPRFQSSPVPKDGCNRPGASWGPVGAAVSILTRPEGRVQLRLARMVEPQAVVSILTRPEGRVQPMQTIYHLDVYVCFNPHPSRRTGATAGEARREQGEGGFNPHPSRRTGATCSYCLLKKRLICFNPHPSRRTGATLARPRAGATVSVSILTRPEGRVQPCGVTNLLATRMFQSSPVPKDGCNRKGGQNRLILVEFQSSPVPKDGCNSFS